MEHAILSGTAGRKALAVLFAAVTLLATAPDASAAKHGRTYTPYRLPPIIAPSAVRGRQNTNALPPAPRIIPAAPPRMTPTVVPPKPPAATPNVVPPTATPPAAPPPVAAIVPPKAPATAPATAPPPAATIAPPKAPTTPPATVPPAVVITPPATPPKAPVTVPSAPAIVDTAPQIGGAPRVAVKVGEAYSFAPAASDANGDKLTFEIANRPSWLSFSSTTGALTGTPTAAQVGTYRNVTIQVAANGKYATLPSFNIEVMSAGSHGVTLSWTPPTRNDDGSALTNLAGYKIRYGVKSGTYTASVTLNTPGVAAYFVDGLVPGTYYFVISAYNSNGTESNLSNEAAKTL